MFENMINCQMFTNSFIIKFAHLVQIDLYPYHNHDVMLPILMKIIHDIWKASEFPFRVIGPVQMVSHVVDVIPLNILQFIELKVIQFINTDHSDRTFHKLI